MSEKETKPAKSYTLRELPGQTIELDLRLESGKRFAFPYSYKIWKEFDTDKGITIRFSTHTVLIKGRNLLPLYEALLQHRVEQIAAANERYDIGPEDDAFVSEIHVTEAKDA